MILDEDFDLYDAYDIADQFDLNAPKGWRSVDGGARTADEWEVSE